MSICIKLIRNWLNQHTAAKQWAWFLILWLGGLMAATALAYPIKWIVRAAQ